MYTLILTLVATMYGNTPNTVKIEGFHSVDDCNTAYKTLQKEYAQSPMRVLAGKCINIPKGN